MVIVISGPIASGKSTVARALARELDRRGARAAVIDLDVVQELPGDDAPRADEETWQRARRASGAHANTLAYEGVDAVIVEGDFLAREARDALEGSLSAAAPPRFVTLTVSFEVAFRRASEDESRTVSRDRSFLRRGYDALPDPPPTDLVIDTESLTPDEAARAIADWA
jgi:adenylylsulfate kinase-like enzyme